MNCCILFHKASFTGIPTSFPKDFIFELAGSTMGFQQLFNIDMKTPDKTPLPAA